VTLVWCAAQLLNGRFLTAKRRYILRYYHRHDAVWPSAQSAAIETLYPSVHVMCEPPTIVSASSAEVRYYFKKPPPPPMPSNLKTVTEPSGGEVLLRSAHVTQGDKIVVSAVKTNCAPPPDLVLDVPEWCGTGALSLDKYPVVPGEYSIKYVSAISGGTVLGSSTLQVQFAAASTALSTTARSREMRLFCCVEGGASTDEEYQIITHTLQHKLQRMCEHLSISFSLSLLGQDAVGASGMGLLARNLADLEESLPYMLAILPAPHEYGKLPKLQDPSASQLTSADADPGQNLSRTGDDGRASQGCPPPATVLLAIFSLAKHLISQPRKLIS